MRRVDWLLALALAGSATAASAQLLDRELGDFELKLGTVPSRSMAQGLIQPARGGTFHGGFDLAHPTGWYAGHWSPSAGLAGERALEIDSYLGFHSPQVSTLGYELGLIRYSFPETTALDRHSAYAGLTLAGNRLGAALSNGPRRSDSRLLMDLDLLDRWGLGLTLEYANHRLDQPRGLADGSALRVYNDWSLNLSRRLLGTDLRLHYTDSDLAGPQCGAYSGLNRYCEDFWMISLERPLF